MNGSRQSQRRLASIGLGLVPVALTALALRAGDIGETGSASAPGDDAFQPAATSTGVPRQAEFSQPVAILVAQIFLSSSNSVELEFTAQPNRGYRVEYCDSLASGSWEPLVLLDPMPLIRNVVLTEAFAPGSQMRFYRIRETRGTFQSGAGDVAVVLDWTPLRRPEKGDAPMLALDMPLPTSNSGGRVHGPRAALSAAQAGVLARDLANAKAQTLYHQEPFRNQRPARLVDGHWVWRDRRGLGAVDFEAAVEFEREGANPKVQVMLLDSRADPFR